MDLKKAADAGSPPLNYWDFSKRYALPLWGYYGLGLVFLAVTTYLTVKIPALGAQFTNGLMALAEPELAQIALLMMGLGVLQILTRSLSRIFIFWPGRQMEVRSRVDLFQKTLQLPQSFLDRFGVGDLISRLANDLGQIRVFYAFGMLQIFNLMFLLVFTISRMWSQNPRLTVLCLLPVLLMLLLTRVLMPKLHYYNKINQEVLGKLTHRVTESFVNVNLVQASGAEAAFAARADEEIDAVYEANMRLVWIRTLLFPLVGSLASVSQVVVLFVGGYEVLNQRLTVGDILAFNSYLVALAFPLTSLGIIISIYQRGKTALERVGVIDQAEIESGRGDLERKASSVLLELKNLSFAYPDRDRGLRPLALDGFHAVVRKGQKIGLCGPVGAGKSTLFQLVSRIYDPPPGTIFFHGQDVLDLEPARLRKAIAYALQTPHLFSSSVAKNLVFGLAEREDEHMVKAASKAQVAEDIERFEQKWQTLVGEKGVRLSGGQKQRLALARLFLRDCELWLLDDVLSAVDAHTEAKMIHELFSEQKAMLIASHRPNVLKVCDEVWYMKDGRLVDQGPFEQLLARYPHLEWEATHE